MSQQVDIEMAICQICKDPTNLVRCVVPTEEKFGSEEIRKLTKIAVHNECLDKLRAAKAAAHVLAMHKARIESWPAMCPAEFQKQIEFGGKSKAKEANLTGTLRWYYRPEGLRITGKTGLCKTRFMWKLLAREWNNGRKVIGFTHADFRSRITALASGDMTACNSYILDLTRSDILFIDDLGKGRRTPAAEEALFMVIDKRVRDNKPTMYTANMNIETFGEQCSEEFREPLVRRIEDNTIHLEF